MSGSSETIRAQAPPPAEAFGYPAEPVEGTRPLLTVLIEFRDSRFAPSRDARFYRKLLFLEELRIEGTIAGVGSFYDEASGSEFVYENAGVLGPYRHPDDPSTPGDERDYACAYAMGSGCPRQVIRTQAIQLAESLGGFPFDSFDTNGDGQVTTDELTIMIVVAEPSTAGAQFRGGSAEPVAFCRQLPDAEANYCGTTIGVGQAVGAATVAHELAHTLSDRPDQPASAAPIEDVYGWNAKNSPYSLMGPTINAPNDERRTWHLDPYHKMRLGWLRPEIVPIDSKSCVELTYAEIGSGPFDPGEDPPKAVLLYDPANPFGEYYLLEYRLPAWLNYDGDPWHTGTFSVPDRGLAVWYVKRAGNRLAKGLPYDLPSGSPPREDKYLYLLPVNGSQGRPGMPALWDENTGPLQLPQLNTTQSVPTWQAHPAGASVRVAFSRVGRETILVALNGAGFDSPGCPPDPGFELSPRVRGTLVPMDEGPCRIRGGGNPVWICGDRLGPTKLKWQARLPIKPGSTLRLRLEVKAKRALKRLVVAPKRTVRGVNAYKPERESWRNVDRRSKARRVLKVKVPRRTSGLVPFPVKVTAKPDRKRAKAKTRLLRTSIFVPAQLLPPEPSDHEPGGRIAFATDRAKNSEIYLMEPDGSELTNLTNDPVVEGEEENAPDDYEPAISPDGTRVAFTTSPGGSGFCAPPCQHVAVIGTTGGEKTRLTSADGGGRMPAWSPDGSKIAFVTDRDGNDEIYVMDAEGGNETRLTTNDARDIQPVWSPDGQRIAFASNRDRATDEDGLEGFEIYSMTAGGEGPVRLTDDELSSLDPDFAPDGSRIAFSRIDPLLFDTGGAGGQSAAWIYAMNADGTQVTRLSTEEAFDLEPSFSPDGRSIVFAGYLDDPNGDIYRRAITGGPSARLTVDPATDVNPSWGTKPPA